MSLRPGVVAFFLGAIVSASAWSTTIFVVSLANGKADLIINGSVVRTLRQGQTSPEGVTLNNASGSAADLTVDGRRVSLGLGQSTSSETRIRADPQGQFFTTVLVNGIALGAQIDTGATNVVLNSDDARRLGIDYLRGKSVISQTANGRITAYLVNLRSVQVGEIVLNDVVGQVSEGGRAQLALALIGMSFLKHVEMRRSGDTLLLFKSHY